MARRTAPRRAKPTRSARKGPSSRRSVKRPTRRAKPRAKAALHKTAMAGKRVAKPAAALKRTAPKAAARKPARLDRKRRTLEETVQTPPSSLDMERRGSAVRTGRHELRESLLDHGGGMTPAITGGDVDANWENAYFSGDEAPGGDNPTPDQEVVDDIGKALGVQYDDREELKAADKIVERDKHRWEMDPASSEDYKDRK